MRFARSLTAILPLRGKTRLAKWYQPYSDEEKIKLKGEVRSPLIRPPHTAAPI